MASDFRWLHFSDLHFGYYDNRADIQDLREKLVRSIRTIGEKFSDIKYVFITGDIAYKGQYSSSANHSMKTLMEEFEKLGIKGEYVFWCCGNHDIVREVMYRTLTIGARSKRESYEETMNDPRTREQLTKNKFENYLKKHQEYIGRTANPNLQDVSQAHFFYALDDLNLIVLNTCIASCDDEDEQQLYIVMGNYMSYLKI